MISNFSRMVSTKTKLKKECSGCGHIFTKKDLGTRVMITTTGRCYCTKCYTSEWDFEAYNECLKGEANETK